MVHSHWLKLSLALIMLLGAWPASPVLAADADAGVVRAPEYAQKIPCTGFFQSGCRPEVMLLIRHWLMSHGLRWDQSRWGLPLAVEVNRAGRWQRLSLLSLHLVRQQP
jgi:hypothetical protein